MDETFGQRLLRLQARICDQPLLLEGDEKTLLRSLQSTLQRASDQRLLRNPPHELFSLVKRTALPPDAAAIRGAVAIAGGEKNQHRSRDKKHFERADGAWFDFTITVARADGPALELLAYDFELRLPDGLQPPPWLRFDLNLPGHDNEEDGLRSHLHPGNDDLQAPAPLMYPLELLDLFIHGFHGRSKPRRKGKEAGV